MLRGLSPKVILEHIFIDNQKQFMMSWKEDYNNAQSATSWLQENAATILNTDLEDFAYEVHKLTGTEVIVFRNHKLALSKREIEVAIAPYQLYQKYFALKESGTTGLETTLENNHTISSNYFFSLPLLRGIIRILALNDTDSFVFQRAQVNTMETVIITITKGGTQLMFDLTHDPT